ncbi:MAG TPA: hypothetical protein VGD47_08235 [Steroidobacteraceae bacterium]
MSGRRRALRVVLSVGLAGLTLAAARAADPSASAEITRCAAITGAAERLACYDALVCAGIAAAEERLACYDALAKRKSAPPLAAPAGASFGLESRKLPATPQGPQLIKALVAKVSVDRLGTVKVSLDNGQSWTFNDPDALLKSGDAVTIRRAALGSFLMTIPNRHTYRVERIE